MRVPKLYLATLGTEEREWDHYYAIDQCDAEYVAIVESDMIVSTRKGYSWIDEAVQGLRDNLNVLLAFWVASAVLSYVRCTLQGIKKHPAVEKEVPNYCQPRSPSIRTP